MHYTLISCQFEEQGCQIEPPLLWERSLHTAVARQLWTRTWEHF